MVPLSTVPVFIGASLVLLLLPGPAVLFIVARSSAQGTRAGLVSVLGVHAATLIHVLAAVVGLSAVVVASAAAFTVVKLLGGAYLVYLGLRSWLGAYRAAAAAAPASAQTSRAATAHAPRRIFAEAFMVSLFNPKVALFFLAFLPQFVQPERGALWAQTLTLGLIYLALGLCTDSIYAALGGRVGSWLHGRAATKLRVTRYAEGAILIGLGLLTVAVPHRRSRVAA